MAQSDFDLLQDSAAIASINRAVTAGTDTPNGGGTFSLGFASKTNDPVSSGYHLNQVGFNPCALGCSIRFATKRGLGGTEFAAFGYVALTGNSVNDTAYIIGLADDEPSNIVLRKGILANSLPNNAAGDPVTLGTLRRSVDQYVADTWIHIRLDVIVNGNGDIVLNCFQNDLDTNPVSAPVWSAISGMGQFIDDVLEVNTGSPPLTGGRVGVAFASEASSRRGYFDYLEVIRQVP